MVHVCDPNDPCGNIKRPVDERDALFYSILKQEHWIIEDVGRECFIEGMRQADKIILLEIPIYVRRKRILLRWIKQNLSIEKCTYKPNFKMLKSMFKWARNYDAGADGTKARVKNFGDKTVVLHNNKEIERYLKSL